MDNGLLIYNDFIKEIKELIYRHQYEAMKKVNIGLLTLYWEIGEEICCKQQEKGWGKSVVEVLSKELQKEFPGVKGFSTTNLWRMRSFYLEYTKNLNLPPLVGETQKQKLPPLVAEIGWSHNCAIIEKCKDPLQREFYMRMTRRFGWTKDVLINNIDNKIYEKYLTNQTNFDETVPEKYQLQAKLAVKDEYNFDFLEMGVQHDETELGKAVMANIRGFIQEMGGYYTIAGDQFRFNVDGDELFIDLLLFHRKLRSLIAIDFKIGEFEPEYVGKMQYYLAGLDEVVKLPDENPSIGIIICKSKKRTRVEYMLKSTNMPIGVATYSYHDNLPENIRILLPSPDEIANIIGVVDEDFEKQNDLE